MASDAQFIARLRAHNVSLRGYRTTLPLMGQTALHEVVRTRSFLRPEGGLHSYIIQPSLNPEPATPNPMQVCDVFAKEILLKRNTDGRWDIPVHVIFTIDFKRMVREEAIPEEMRGGYIALAYVGDNIEDLAGGRETWWFIQELLTRHTRRGGGLILGDMGFINAGKLSPAFAEAMEDYQFVNVQ